MITLPPTVYIDPGVKYLGWALFEDGEVTLCGKTARESIVEIAAYADRAVIEKPYIESRHGKGKVTLADLQELCIAVGEYGGHFPIRRYVFPHKLPKEIRHSRALRACRPHEIVRLPQFKTHMFHVGCALYMGMRETGRIVA